MDKKNHKTKIKEETKQVIFFCMPLQLLNNYARLKPSHDQASYQPTLNILVALRIHKLPKKFSNLKQNHLVWS